MKPNVLLVASGSASNAIVDAAARTGRGLRHVQSSSDAFKMLSSRLDDVDVVIVDLDPGMHSISVLEAIGLCEGVPPVIVVTGLEELEMAPIAYRHGAAACIGKPFDAAELASVIEEVCWPGGQAWAMSCDLWGHPLGISQRKFRSQAA